MHGALELFMHDQPEATSPLLLCEQGVLHEPMLYLSLSFKTHHDATPSTQST